MLSPKPKMPQFSSHSRSLNLYLPDKRLMPVRPASMLVWCENKPSMMSV